jgi:hypothetical protein
MDVATVTLIVLIVQAVIYGFMLWRMTEANKVTKIAANAAKESAKAATATVELAKKTTAMTERPIVLLESVVLSSEHLKPGTTIIFRLKNYGRTVAYSVKMAGKIIALGSEPIDPMPDTTIAPEGIHEWNTRSIGMRLQPEQVLEIANGRQALQYEVEITYADTFEQGHHCKAVGKYVAGGGIKRFIMTGSSSD